ncbi:MAG: GNAT family N-acetyltransferase [Myxococcaceae bacterium]|nr:GNAT family N-acetyltransferase [Myxococcaceae bacterium]
MGASGTSFAFGRPAGDAERLRLGEVLAESFNFPAADAPAWFDYSGHENLRVLRRGSEVVGGLVGIPMGQFWGGRPVRLFGVAGVAVAPWARGSGAATWMMGEALREARQAGFPLAGLYPATQPVYRRVGYEQAGVRCELRAPVISVPEGPREPALRPFVAQDLPAVQALYRELAQHRQGWLDRGSYVWHRVQHPRGMAASGYVLEEGGRLTGYVFLARVRPPGSTFNFDLVLTDWAARSPNGWRRLLTFLADHGSLVRDIVWYGGPADPLVQLFDEQTVSTQVLYQWMLRVLDVEAALTARGYPRGMTASLHLEVEDALLPENAGRWVLEVSGGEARVRRGGEGALRCDARALACLYSGHRTASALAAVGVLQGTPDALVSAEALFAGPAPHMPDMY